MSQLSNELNLEDLVVVDGDEVKALGDGRIGGYLVRFSTEEDPDISVFRDFFTKETDFGPHTTTPVLYHHGRDQTLGLRRLAENAKLRVDDVGVWIDAQLQMRDEYERAIYALVRKGKLSWSSGTAGHLVEREPRGDAHWVRSWPLGLDASLTPTPAEYRAQAVAVKSVPDPPSIKELLENVILQEGDDVQNSEKAEATETAAEVAVEEEPQPGWTLRDLASRVANALWEEFRIGGMDDDDAVLVYDAFVVYQRGDGWYRRDYTIDGNSVSFSLTEVPVRQEWVEASKRLAASRGEAAFADHTADVMRAVDGWIERVQAIAALRGKPAGTPIVSATNAKRLEEISDRLRTALERIDALRAFGEPERKTADIEEEIILTQRRLRLAAIVHATRARELAQWRA